jgi:mRNA interferase MazF
VLLVSNDAANRNLARVVVVPLTSSTGRIYPGEAVVTVGGQSKMSKVRAQSSLARAVNERKESAEALLVKRVNLGLI